MTVTNRAATAAFSVLALGCGAASSRLGVDAGRLAPCPSVRPCVSSQAADTGRAVEPLAYDGTREQARKRLGEIIRSLPRAQVVTEASDYVHAVFPTPIVGIFGCADDLEVYLDDREKLAHFRSSSRIRPFDFGANKSRVEEIRRKFLAAKS